MIVKEYREHTEEERRQEQDAWVEVLDTFCPADDLTGNRPCDNGCPCDKCHYDYGLQRKYAKLLVERDLPLTPRQTEYFSD